MFRKLSLRVTLILPFVLIPLGLNSAASAQTAGARCDAYAGRYQMPDQWILIVAESNGVLSAQPMYRRSLQALEPAGPDTFAFVDRPERKLLFERDAHRCITAIRLIGAGNGTDRFPRLGSAPTPVELLMAGQPRPAALLMARDHSGEPKRFAELARAVVDDFPSRSLTAAAFLRTGLQFYPRSAELMAGLGDAYISAGQRAEARASYLRAYELDPKNAWAVRALERLNARPTSAGPAQLGWTVPFSLDRLFATPTHAEIDMVLAIWAKRDLKPSDVQEVAQGRLDLGPTPAAVRIVSYRVHGELNYGAIIVPDVAQSGRAPVILDLKGVSPDFFPLELTHLISPSMLGADRGKFIYFVPSFRGERLIFDGHTYLSEGDPNDSWDGAADDSIAFLTAALALTPQADPDRIGVFGKSRGGALALLTGERDRRIKLVVDWSGPVDWFQEMGAYGWTPREVVGDGLRYQVEPKEDGGQFIATFLAKSIHGARGLEEVRLHMIASSPLDFADRLPPTQAHSGVEDDMVPVGNGRALLATFRRSSRRTSSYEVIFHPASGHDLYAPEANRRSHDFIVARLLGGR